MKSFGTVIACYWRSFQGSRLSCFIYFRPFMSYSRAGSGVAGSKSRVIMEEELGVGGRVEYAD